MRPLAKDGRFFRLVPANGIGPSGFVKRRSSPSEAACDGRGRLLEKLWIAAPSLLQKPGACSCGLFVFALAALWWDGLRTATVHCNLVLCVRPGQQIVAERKVKKKRVLVPKNAQIQLITFQIGVLE